MARQRKENLARGQRNMTLIVDKNLIPIQRCPVCWSERTYVVAVIIKVANDWVGYNRDGLKQVVLPKELSDGNTLVYEPGSYITLHFYCENGHFWLREYHSHNGTTVITSRCYPAMNIDGKIPTLEAS